MLRAPQSPNVADGTQAVAALERHGIAQVETGRLRRSDRLLRIQHSIALDCLLAHDPNPTLVGMSSSEVTAEMRAVRDPPREYLELEEIASRISEVRDRIDSGSLSPITRMKLLSCTSTRNDVRRFCAHLRAFVDPFDLEGNRYNAKDVFLGRLPGMSAAHRTYFAAWIEAASPRR